MWRSTHSIRWLASTPGVIHHSPLAAFETYERPGIAGSGAIACGLAACASVAVTGLWWRGGSAFVSDVGLSR